MSNKNEKQVGIQTSSKKSQPNTKGKATKLDEHVGQRLRVRRNMLGMSQEKLADLLGLTFQQIQKYERGKNRISASRLYELSKILDVSIDFFFSTLNKSSKSSNEMNYGFSDSSQEDFVSDDKLTTKETLDLIRVYYSIDNPELRKNLFTFIKSMAENMKNEDT